MNRVIKFRVWNVNGSCMHQWSELVEKNKIHLLSNQQSAYPVMQFTGMHDVNGAEIFEGDIVCRLFESCGQTKRGRAVAVKFCEFEISVQGAILDVPTIGFNIDGEPLATDERYEVVGNIYENPELLVI